MGRGDTGVPNNTHPEMQPKGIYLCPPAPPRGTEKKNRVAGREKLKHKGGGTKIYHPP